MRISFLLSIGAFFIVFPVHVFAALDIGSSAVIDEDSTNGPATAPWSLDAGDVYGASIAAIGDLDGDGVEDIAVGAAYDEGDSGNTEDSGAVFIHFMNTDGSIDSSVKLSEDTPNGASTAGTLNAFDYYGISVARIGDLNDDGVDDLIVGAPQDEGDIGGTSSSGAVYIHFMNTDGSIDSSVKLSEDTPNGASDGVLSGQLELGDRYGVGVAGIGDLNDDGVEDIAVGAYYDEGVVSGTSQSGAVYIHFMNTDGSIISTVKLDEDTPNGPNSGSYSLDGTDHYGVSVAALGDFNDDGVEDIAVGAHKDEGDVTGTADSGAVFIHFLNDDASIASTVKLDEDTPNGAASAGSLDASDSYGNSVALVEDINGDGVDDLVVGAPQDSGDDTDTFGSGAIYVHLMESDGGVIESAKFDEDTVNGFTTQNPANFLAAYGYSVAGLEDYDGDGITDIAVGAPYTTNDDTGTSNAGAIYIHYMAFTAQIDVSGTVYSDFGSTPIANGTQVELLVGGVSAGTTTTTSGAYAFTDVTVTENDVITVYIDNGSDYGATVTRTDSSSNLTGINIYENTIIVRNDSGGALTNTNLDTGNPGTDANLTAVYADASGAGTFTSGSQQTTLYVPAGHAYAPGGNVDLANDVRVAGTLQLGSATLALGGDWVTDTGATITTGSSTVQFDGTSTQQVIGSTSLNAVTVANTGARTFGVQEDSTFTIAGTLSIPASSGNTVTIRSVNSAGLVLSDDSTHTWNITGSFGTVSGVNVRDSILQEDGSVKSPALDPANSTDAGNTQGWFTSTESEESDSATPTYRIRQRVMKPSHKTATVGDIVRYRIRVRNTGDTALTALTLKNTYPHKKLKFLSSSVDPVNSKNDGSIRWSNVLRGRTLQPGRTIDVYVRFRVQQVPSKKSQRGVTHTVYGRNAVDSNGNPAANTKKSNTAVRLYIPLTDVTFQTYIVNPDGRHRGTQNGGARVATGADGDTVTFEDNVDNDFNDVALRVQKQLTKRRFEVTALSHDARLNHDVWFDVVVRGIVKYRTRLWKNSITFAGENALAQMRLRFWKYIR